DLILSDDERSRQIDAPCADVVRAGISRSMILEPRIGRQRRQRVEEWPRRKTELSEPGDGFEFVDLVALPEQEAGDPDAVEHPLRLGVEVEIVDVRQPILVALIDPPLFRDQLVQALELRVAERR